LFGADLLSFGGSEAATAAVEQQRCTCGVRPGRYFMGEHSAPCPVRAEYRAQSARVFDGGEIDRPPTDGYYRVHYLRYPRGIWVHSRIEAMSQCVAIVHGVREQACRFGVQPRTDRPPVGLDNMLPPVESLSLFDILPERLQSAPFSTTREELTTLGIDRPSPRSRPRPPRPYRRRPQTTATTGNIDPPPNKRRRSH
jgi:hypothetical protein